MPTDYQLTCGTKTKRFMACRQTASGLVWELKVLPPPHTQREGEGQHNTHHTFCNVSSRVGFNWKPPEGVLCEPVFLDFTHSEQERVIVHARGGGGEEVNSLSVVSTLSSQGRVVDHA